MKFILAEKKEMTQKFTDDGRVIPVTKAVAGPCVIIQVKGQPKDGYTAVQIGFGSKKKLTKPLVGHLKKLGNFQYLKEFRITEDEANKLKVGDKISVNTFKAGDIVKVTGNSKGRGFQGVVKKYGFSGSPASHGHKDQLRMPGSIGATGPAHVFKGTRMGGRMGGGQVTVKNLEVVDIDPQTNEIFIKGAIPGSRNNLILISGSGDLIIAEESKPEKLADKPVVDDSNSKDEKSTDNNIKDQETANLKESEGKKAAEGKTNSPEVEGALPADSKPEDKKSAEVDSNVDKKEDKK